MCEKCGKRKAEIALFLSEHGPQLGIRSERALIAWSDINALVVEGTQLPADPMQTLHRDLWERAKRIMEGLSLSDLEQIHFVSAVLQMTGCGHGNDASAIMRAKYRAGERDPNLSVEAIASIEAAIARENFSTDLQKGITDALTQVFEKKGSASGVTVYVPGNGKPVPPS